MEKNRLFKGIKPSNYGGTSENHAHRGNTSSITHNITCNVKREIESNVQKQEHQTSKRTLFASLNTYASLLFPLIVQLLGKYLRILLPNYCRLCKAECRHYLCEACTDELPHISNPCHVCSLPLMSNPPDTLGCELSSAPSPRASKFKTVSSKPAIPTSTAPTEIQLQAPSSQFSSRSTEPKSSPTICGECLKSPPLFKATLCSFEYQYPLNKLINQFKYQSDIHLGKFLCSILSVKINTQITSMEGKLPQALTYVPAHWHKRFTREFNQAHFIAQELSEQTNIPIYSLFKKVKNTPTQHTLNKKARRQNLTDSFCLNQRALEKLRRENIEHIAIIDDVMTTGSTANSLAKITKEIGITEIDIWILARTPKPKA